MIMALSSSEKESAPFGEAPEGPVPGKRGQTLIFRPFLSMTAAPFSFFVPSYVRIRCSRYDHRGCDS